MNNECVKIHRHRQDMSAAERQAATDSIRLRTVQGECSFSAKRMARVPCLIIPGILELDNAIDHGVHSERP